MKSPIVEKDAGAEVLLWRVHVVDELLGDNREFQRVFYHYVRLKIFDEKGREKAATIDLTYREPGGILDVAGRTIKPDGSVIELDKKAIFKRDVIRAGKFREKAVSFAMPGVEPGAIVEYRWKQLENDNRFRYLQIHFQREFPVQKVTWFVKPLSRDIISGQMFVMPVNSTPSPIHMENDGYASTTMENVPAAREEPYAPSRLNTAPWALLYYRDGPGNPDKLWNETGKTKWRDAKASLKISEEMKKAAADAVAAAKTDDEKLASLVMAVRRTVRNVLDPEVTDAERQAYFTKLNKGRDRNTAEMFQGGLALPGEMNLIFLALASQAGFEARPVLIASRDLRFEPKARPDTYFNDGSAVAVKRGDKWKVLAVESKLLDPLMLPQDEEGVYALICDPKDPVYITTPIAAPQSSTELRTARLKLSVEGSLEGDVEEPLTSYSGEERREAWRGHSPAQREEAVHDRLERMFPNSEITGISIENADDPSKPAIVRYHLNAPLFAQVTGKRLLFQPIAFRRAQASPFTTTERRLDVEFPFAWKEIDQIHILLPDGFDLDNAGAPANLALGKAGSYDVKMTVLTTGARELYTLREFSFSDGGALMYPVAIYPTLKKAFDTIEVRDQHTLSLKGQ